MNLSKKLFNAWVVASFLLTQVYSTNAWATRPEPEDFNQRFLKVSPKSKKSEVVKIPEPLDVREDPHSIILGVKTEGTQSLWGGTVTVSKESILFNNVTLRKNLTFERQDASIIFSGDNSLNSIQAPTGKLKNLGNLTLSNGVSPSTLEIFKNKGDFSLINTTLHTTLFKNKTTAIFDQTFKLIMGQLLNDGVFEFKVPVRMEFHNPLSRIGRMISVHEGHVILPDDPKVQATILNNFSEVKMPLVFSGQEFKRKSLEELKTLLHLKEEKEQELDEEVSSKTSYSPSIINRIPEDFPAAQIALTYKSPLLELWINTFDNTPKLLLSTHTLQEREETFEDYFEHQGKLSYLLYKVTLKENRLTLLKGKSPYSIALFGPSVLKIQIGEHQTLDVLESDKDIAFYGLQLEIPYALILAKAHLKAFIHERITLGEPHTEEVTTQIP